MQFSERVQSITQDNYVPIVVDQVLDSNVITARVFSNVKRWSGESLVVPIETARHANVGSFQDLDTFSQGAESTRKRLRFYPKAVYGNVTIGGMDKAVNKTDAQVLDLIRTEMHGVQNSLLYEIGTELYGDGTGNSGKAIDGVKTIADDGTVVASYGGLTRASNTYLNASVTGTIGTLGLGNLRAAIRNASAASNRRTRPTLGLMNETVWDIVEALYPTPQAQYQTMDLPQVTATSRPGTVVRDQNLLAGALGYTALYWKGVPMVADDLAPSGTIYFLNEFTFDWYSLKSADLQDVPRLNVIDSAQNDSEAGVNSAQPIQWRDFMEAQGSFRQDGQFILMGNLVSTAPRRNTRLDGITG